MSRAVEAVLAWFLCGAVHGAVHILAAVALGKTFKAYKKAKGNKNEAKMLAERAQVSPSARDSGYRAREGASFNGHATR